MPLGWSVNRGFIKRLNGEKVIDFENNNLHVWSHSTSFMGVISYDDLKHHLITLPSSPTAIPYVTTYYENKWGFSLTHEVFESMKDNAYEVCLDTSFYDHSMKVLEVVIPGHSDSEILLSSYLCHPSMVNNELSGPVILTALANFILSKKRRYTYRLLIAPETIGPIFYLSKMAEHLRSSTIMAWNMTCLGDSHNWSFLQSRRGNEIVDEVSKAVLLACNKEYKMYNFNSRGSDERQFSSPNIDIPMASIMRSKYTEFSEYHTSLDDLNFVGPESLFESYELFCTLIETLDFEGKYFSKFVGEPFLQNFFNRSKVGGRFEGYSEDLASKINNFVAYSDGSSLFEIAHLTGENIVETALLAKKALELGMVRLENHKSLNN